MPYPLVHLHVANNLVTHLGVRQKEVPVFLMGSLAPDACHISEIPKRLTHFWDEEKNSFSPENFQSRFLPINTLRPGAPGESERVSHVFILGYLCHLITDDLWLNTVARPLFHAPYPDKKLRAKMYYQECDQVERELYKKTNGRHLLESIRSCPPVSLPGVVSREAVDAWRRRVLAWDWHGAAANSRSQTLSVQLVEEFIARATSQNELKLNGK